jgi:hypothetical protein
MQQVAAGILPAEGASENQLVLKRWAVRGADSAGKMPAATFQITRPRFSSLGHASALTAPRAAQNASHCGQASIDNGLVSTSAGLQPAARRSRIVRPPARFASRRPVASQTSGA